MSDEMRDFIDFLELPYEGEEGDKNYILNLNSSNEFSKVFDLIDTNKDLFIKGESKATGDETSFRFTDGIYDVVLNANYDKDIYQVVVEVE